MNNTVKNKIKRLPQLFNFRPTISLTTKLSLLYFLINHYTKLDIYVYMHRNDYICKGLLQTSRNNYLIEIFGQNEPPPPHLLYQILMP